MIDLVETRVELNGIHLNYMRSSGDKPSIVMLHGITDNGFCWSRLVDSLVNDFEVVLLDARGHGKSDKPSQDYTWTAMAEDAASLVTKLRLDSPVVIGHSMGAQTAAIMAANHPGIAGKMILEDPPWKKPSIRMRNHPLDHAKKMRGEIVLNKKMSVNDLTSQKMAVSPLWDAAEFPYWSEAKHQVDTEISNLILTENIPYTKTVPEITCPCLLVTGDPQLEAVVTQELAQEIQRMNPNFNVAHIQGTGHNIRRENFARFLTIVKEYLLG